MADTNHSRRALDRFFCWAYDHGFMRIPEIDEETMKKLPYWKQWLYRTMKEIEEEKWSAHVFPQEFLGG